MAAFSEKMKSSMFMASGWVLAMFSEVFRSCCAIPLGVFCTCGRTGLSCAESAGKVSNAAASDGVHINNDREGPWDGIPARSKSCKPQLQAAAPEDNDGDSWGRGPIQARERSYLL